MCMQKVLCPSFRYEFLNCGVLTCLMVLTYNPQLFCFFNQSHSDGEKANLNEDTLGCHLKAAIAQYVSLEFTRGNGRENRAITRYLPWLYHPPSTLQQG